MQSVRVGIVGLGGICRSRHVPGLRRIEGVEIVAATNRTPESSRAVADEFGIPETCASWQELVARDDLDAIVIGTWPYLHRDISIAAIQAGKHVFCQARMAMDAAEAQDMCAAAESSELVAMLCPVPVGLSIDATVARMSREGVLGDVRLVRVQSFTDAFASPDAPMNWRKDHRLSGLNMWTLGMYAEVVHRWFGWTRTVTAATQTFVSERVDESGKRIEVEIPDQVLVHTTTVSGVPMQYTISAAVHNGTDAIEIYGTGQTLRYDVGADILYASAPGEPMKPVHIHREDRYDVANWRVEEDFVDAIRTGSEYHPNFEDGFHYMQMVQAVYDSASRQCTVALD
ncbi:MAG: Gfo/Idh/MocA family oxidoreductase [bacterium]|nr:Gfo/Idh/MocA family oxidoreductase [bacterium]